jgi:hypothetical protein
VRVRRTADGAPLVPELRHTFVSIVSDNDGLPHSGMIGHCLGKPERISMRAFQAADAARSSDELQKEDVHALLR